MGDNEIVDGEVVEPEVEDLKSDAWRYLKKNFHFFRRVKKIPEKMKSLTTRSNNKSLHNKTLGSVQLTSIKKS